MSTINREIFSELIREFSPNMYRLAVAMLRSSHDAEDAVSESIIILFYYVQLWLVKKRFKDKSQ